MDFRKVEDAIKAFSEFSPHSVSPKGREVEQYELNIVWVAQDKKYTEGLYESVKELKLEGIV